MSSGGPQPARGDEHEPENRPGDPSAERGGDPGPQDLTGSSAAFHGVPGLRPADDAIRIDGYEIGEPLGRGSSGVVYRARQLTVDREVALKVLHPELSARPRVVQRLQREARTTARLAHPNVVSAIDMGSADGRWWYAMELVEGPSLERRLRSEGRLSEREALRLFIPLCAALEHLWEHGVVHRDVKPANILIDRRGVARLADLGLAFADDEPGLTKTGGMLGTPHYVSPEQAVDPTAVDIRGDLWSMGATLFHALCGEPPFAGASSAEVLSAVLYEAIPDPLELAPDLSKGFALVLRKCLVRDVRRRYQTPRELRRDLERVRERRAPAVRVSRLDPVQRAGRLRDPRRVLHALAALALVAGVAAFGWHLFGPTDGRRSADDPSAGASARGGARPDRPAWEPLEELARRREQGASAAALLTEIETLLPALESRDREAARTLRAELLGGLWRDLDALEEELEAELQERLSVRDFAGALAFVRQELEPRTVAALGASGIRLRTLDAGLDARLEDWNEGASERIESASAAALRELEGRLADWRRARLALGEELVSAGHWDAAVEQLQPRAEELLEAVGFAEARFADRRAQDLVAGEMVLFSLRRQRLADDWERLDRGLLRAVDEERARLRSRFENGPPPERGAMVSAAAGDVCTELREAFEDEARARGLDPHALPKGFPSRAAQALEEACDELTAAVDEQERLRLSAELDELEAIAAGFASRREYEAMRRIWEEAQPLFGSDPGGAASGLVGDSAWRRALARTAELRRIEAGLLEELFQRAADRVRQLAEEPSDVRLGSIVYPNARLFLDEPIEARGFRLEGRAKPLYLQTLPLASFEEFAGLARPGLSALDRLRLASLRHAEGDPAAAGEVLRAGPGPRSEPWRELTEDLLGRIEASRSEHDLALRERQDAAARLVELALDPERRRTTPLSVLARIERLFDEYGELASVRERRDELLAVRDELQGGVPADAPAFQTAFAPTGLAFPAGRRVQLAFDFEASLVGTWDRRDWIADGSAWRPRERPRNLDAFARQRGPRLVLREPLDLDGGPLGLELELDLEPDGLRLFVLSLAGTHVALVGPSLPGDGGGARWLVATNGFLGLMERLREGGGEPLPASVVASLEKGGRHRLRLSLVRRSGRVELAFDGLPLGSVQPTPSADLRTLDLRAWGQLRLLRAVLEAER